jgi:mRNA interferase RelE/StbE
MNTHMKERMKNALRRLGEEPPKGDIKPLAGQNRYRLRVGDYRVLFGINKDVIAVYDIGPRGQIYKK